MWHKVRTALSLPVSDLWVLAQAWVLLLMVDLGLRTLPFQSVINCLKWGERFTRRCDITDEFAHVRRLSQLVKVAGRNHIYKMTCLRQALVLRFLLSLDNIPSDLQIGVRKEAGSIDAHAWVEYKGSPVGEQQISLKNFDPLVIPEAGL